MHMVKFEGEFERAFNKELRELKLKDGSFYSGPTSIALNGEYEAFGVDKEDSAYLDSDWEAALEEMRVKNEFPTAKEIVQMRNAKRLAKAKAAETTRQVALAGLVQPTTENDPQMRLKKAAEMFYLSIDAAIREADPEAAKQLARQEAAAFLKLQWAE